MMTTYSVIIPSRGRPGMLREALWSVKAQTLPASRIVVVLDEAEGDIAYPFLDGRMPGLEVVFTGGGKGGAGARNLGLDRVATGLVFFLDDDDIWFPHKAERQVALLSLRPECVGVTCWREIHRSSGVQIEKVHEHRLNLRIRRTNYVGSFSFFGMRLTQATRGLRLDENLPAAQDMEFYMNLSRHGTIGVVPEVLARYRAHEAERISHDRNAKLWAIRYTNEKYWHEMSMGDRMWNHGKFLVRGAARHQSVFRAIVDIATGFVLMVSSGSDWGRAARTAWRSWTRWKPRLHSPTS